MRRIQPEAWAVARPRRGTGHRGLRRSRAGWATGFTSFEHSWIADENEGCGHRGPGIIGRVARVRGGVNCRIAQRPGPPTRPRARPPRLRWQHAAQSPDSANAPATPSASSLSNPLGDHALGSFLACAIRRAHTRNSAAEQIRGHGPGGGYRVDAQIVAAHVDLDAVDASRWPVAPPRSRGRCRAPAPAPTRAARRRSPAPRSRNPGRRSPPPAAAPARASAPGTAGWWRGRRSQTPAPGRSRGRSPSSPGGSHGGRTVSRPPSTSGSWNCRQRSVPVVGDLGRGDLDQRPACGRASGRAASAARRAPRRRRTRSCRGRSAPPRRPRAPARAARRARARRARAARGRASRTMRSRPCQRSATPPNARLSLPNTPSSVRRFSSVIESASCSQQLALLALQAPRDDDVDDHAQVAAAPAAQRRHPGAAHDQRLVRLRAGRDLELDRLADRRHLRPCVPSAASGAATSTAVTRSSPSRTKRGVLAHAHLHVQVAGRSAALAGVPASRDPDPLAVGDPGRHVDRDLGALDLAAPALDRPCTGSRGTRPSPWHTSHAAARTTWPNGVRETARSWPVPSQRAQVSIGVPGSAPLPWQCSQQRDRLVGDLDRGAAARPARDRSRPRPRRRRPGSRPPRRAAAAERARRTPPPPKNASKMSATEPKPSKFGA